MSEVLFYHLMDFPMEKVLPGLLEKSLERKWRCVVQVEDEGQLMPLDELLWSYKPNGFLAHDIIEDEGEKSDAPICLTVLKDNPNEATVLFVLNGAEPPELSPYTRSVFIFDGHDGDAVKKARAQWKIQKDAGHDLTYWQQNQEGRWEKKA